jgi:hypothetical protein
LIDAVMTDPSKRWLCAEATISGYFFSLNVAGSASNPLNGSAANKTVLWT